MHEYEQALLLALKCVEDVLESQSEAYGLWAQAKLAEIMCMLEMPSEGLNMIECKVASGHTIAIREKAQLVADNRLKAELELIKAKILIRLQTHLPNRSYGTAPLPLFAAAVVSLKRALELATQQCDLHTMREIFYMLARLFNELGEEKRRDKAALMFANADEEMQANARHSLGSICHFQLPALVETELAQVDAFQAKYGVVF